MNIAIINPVINNTPAIPSAKNVNNTVFNTFIYHLPPYTFIIGVVHTAKKEEESDHCQTLSESYFFFLANFPISAPIPIIANIQMIGSSKTAAPKHTTTNTIAAIISKIVKHIILHYLLRIFFL